MPAADGDLEHPRIAIAIAEFPAQRRLPARTAEILTRPMADADPLSRALRAAFEPVAAMLDGAADEANRVWLRAEFRRRSRVATARGILVGVALGRAVALAWGWLNAPRFR